MGSPNHPISIFSDQFPGIGPYWSLLILVESYYSLWSPIDPKASAAVVVPGEGGAYWPCGCLLPTAHSWQMVGQAPGPNCTGGPWHGMERQIHGTGGPLARDIFRIPTEGCPSPRNVFNWTRLGP